MVIKPRMKIAHGTILASALLAGLSAAAMAGQQREAPAPLTAARYQERYRPQIHFTPARNWMNDPNGLVYYDGEYHLFYQYNPLGMSWGHMSWGHAVSTDLLHWNELAVALNEDQHDQMYSGSVVVDTQNTSGFGTAGHPPMVAIYTGSPQKIGNPQTQQLAFSLDRGRTWTKYAGNPVLDIGLKDFRDPKVFWHEPSKAWVMVVALPAARKVSFYQSANLKTWTHLSDFGPAGVTEGAWECPDLYALPVDGLPGQTRWVLKVDSLQKAAGSGAGGQAFIGGFDGKTFVPEKQQAQRIDLGEDYYAAITWSNLPESQHRQLSLGWMSNWKYAGSTPTSPWRNAMSLPHELSLKATSAGFALVQSPIRELEALRDLHRRRDNIALGTTPVVILDSSDRPHELEMVIDLSKARNVGLRIGAASNVDLVIGYNAVSGKLYVERGKTGDAKFDATFVAKADLPLAVQDGKLRLRLFIDKSSVEVFANGGERVITEQIFPKSGSIGVTAFAEGNGVVVKSLDIWSLKSVW